MGGKYNQENILSCVFLLSQSPPLHYAFSSVGNARMRVARFPFVSLQIRGQILISPGKSR